MSNEFDSQIAESVLKEKILKFYQKKKYFIFLLLFVLLFMPISYQIYLSLDKKKHANELMKYSEVLLLNNKNLKITNLEKLLSSDNEVVAMLSLHKLFENTNSNNKELRISYIKKLLMNNSLSTNNQKLIKIKKSLLLFDNANEKEMLELLNDNIENSHLKKVSFLILYDFYIKNNQKIKAEEFMRLINENY